MKKMSLLAAILLSLVFSRSFMPQLAYADVHWTTKKQLDLESTPLDISTSADGQMIFILAPGEVLVYSPSEDKVMKRIPIDEAFDRLTHSEKDNTLILTNSSGKTLRIIQLEMIYEISVSGLPFKGPENAPVTIAVFNDYQ